MPLCSELRHAVSPYIRTGFVGNTTKPDRFRKSGPSQIMRAKGPPEKLITPLERIVSLSRIHCFSPSLWHGRCQ